MSYNLLDARLLYLISSIGYSPCLRLYIPVYRPS
jgi:hypothetical protein